MSMPSKAPSHTMARSSLFITCRIRASLFLQHFLAHEVVTDGRTHSFSNPSFLLGDDAGSERHPPSHDVLCRVRAEQHADGYVVGDVADDATNQWGYNIRCDDHKFFLNSNS